MTLEWAEDEQQIRLVRDGETIGSIERWTGKDHKTAWWRLVAPDLGMFGEAMEPTLAEACARLTAFLGVTIDPPAQLLAEWADEAPAATAHAEAQASTASLDPQPHTTFALTDFVVQAALKVIEERHPGAVISPQAAHDAVAAAFAAAFPFLTIRSLR